MTSEQQHERETASDSRTHADVLHQIFGGDLDRYERALKSLLDDTSKHMEQTSALSVALIGAIGIWSRGSPNIVAIAAAVIFAATVFSAFIHRSNDLQTQFEAIAAGKIVKSPVIVRFLASKIPRIHLFTFPIAALLAVISLAIPKSWPAGAIASQDAAVEPGPSHSNEANDAVPTLLPSPG